jgi:D-alanyl-D-alanine carboxypeptidase
MLGAGLMIALMSLTPATAAHYASIIIDADTGKVLQAVNADETNYPASLTKMMTLYLLFGALDSGKVKLNDKLPVSKHAASRPPTKLGLHPGDTVSIHDLMLGLVTQSANDAASVLAEGLAGSEPAFAARMTAKAHELGMKNTVFYNASGLPDRHHPNVTTARDLATLARALYRDFPNHYHVFATREFEFHGRTMKNHNHLMSSYPGMDGIKTGYINASGFNLAASAVQDNHRLIGVVMGGQSARGRDHKMAHLLDAGFAREEKGGVMVAKAEQADPQDDSEPANVAERAVAALSPVSTAEAAPVRTRHKAHKQSASRWAIQVGAFSKRSAAEKAAHAAYGRLTALKDREIAVLSPRKTEKERFYRARLVNLSKREADRACSLLHRHRHACAVVAPATVSVANN